MIPAPDDQIAEQVGYSNVPNFSRVFKGVTGVLRHAPFPPTDRRPRT